MLQSEECFRNRRRFLVLNHRRENAALLHTVLQYRKTAVTLVCFGTVSGIYYTSLDRQSRRKLRATADGLVRFIRYCTVTIHWVRSSFAKTKVYDKSLRPKSKVLSRLFVYFY